MVVYSTASNSPSTLMVFNKSVIFFSSAITHYHLRITSITGTLIRSVSYTFSVHLERIENSIGFPVSKHSSIVEITSQDFQSSEKLIDWHQHGPPPRVAILEEKLTRTHQEREEEYVRHTTAQRHRAESAPRTKEGYQQLTPGSLDDGFWLYIYTWLIVAPTRGGTVRPSKSRHCLLTD